MTLKKIGVKNFQSIRDAEVELGSFTVLTGPSNSGKSAFMRAARALVRNGFTPSQVRQGTKETHVVLEFDDHTVEAVRGKSKSTYILDGDEYNKAGRTVPPEAEAAMRLGLVSEVDSTFSTQYDSPYLISDPGSTAAKVLGSLTNVSVLHNGLRETNRRTLEAKAQLKSRNSDLTTYKEREASFEYVDEKRRIMDKAEAVMSELSKLGEDVSLLDSILKLLDIDILGLKEANESIVSLPPNADIEELIALTNLVKDLDLEVGTVESLIEQIPKEDYSGFSDISKTYDILVEDVSAVKALAEVLEGTVAGIKEYQEKKLEASKYEEELEKCNHEHTTLLDGIDICPLCGEPVDRR